MSSFNINKKYTIDKSKSLFSKNYLLITIIKISLAFSLPYNYNYLTTRLNNGNFLVFSDNGVFIFDPTFTNSSKIKRINYTNSYNNFKLAHFSEEDGGYILFITNQYQYVLFSNGTLFNAISFSLPYSSSYYYSVIPYNHYNNSYYYFVILLDCETSLNNDYYFNFKKYGFFLCNKNIQYFRERHFKSNNIVYSYFSCQLMKFNNTNSITCCFLEKYNYYD